ncbi:TetR/AcrR family transcriptional regulator [Streptomyces sp. NBC_01477]|uniref:TetR/AcrR family transcriptional regulator n=1 Tax=Streptomyces sp. NBC_01477 TaxID=2976015 RepID=UPI002E367CE4|nr:TetR/AcrR family transcriptional regulator [Streptomyces sp. NBC_01477]
MAATRSGARVDGRVARGNETRRLVLERAVSVASVEGLDGLTVGRLAGDLGLSKSGVFALFGSKEDLQLATVRTAIRIFLEHVVHPAHGLPHGMDRLWRLCDGWLAYSQTRVFPGGCFFYSAAAEYDARPGRLHDTIAAARRNWSSFLEQTLREAQQAGEARQDADRAQLVFEICALMEMANGESVLHGDDACYRMAARGILNRLRDTATDPALLPADRA